MDSHCSFHLWSCASAMMVDADAREISRQDLKNHSRRRVTLSTVVRCRLLLLLNLTRLVLHQRRRPNRRRPRTLLANLLPVRRIVWAAACRYPPCWARMQTGHPAIHHHPPSSRAHPCRPLPLDPHTPLLALREPCLRRLFLRGRRLPWINLSSDDRRLQINCIPRIISINLASQGRGPGAGLRSRRRRRRRRPRSRNSVPRVVPSLSRSIPTNPQPR